MSDQQEKCLWCSLPKATKGIVIGILVSVGLHAAVLGAIYLMKEQPKRKPRVLLMGNITVFVPKYGVLK
jgi:hypothetical protein